MKIREGLQEQFDKAEEMSVDEQNVAGIQREVAEKPENRLEGPIKAAPASSKEFIEEILKKATKEGAAAEVPESAEEDSGRIRILRRLAEGRGPKAERARDLLNENNGGGEIPGTQQTDVPEKPEEKFDKSDEVEREKPKEEIAPEVKNETAEATERMRYVSLTDAINEVHKAGGRTRDIFSPDLVKTMNSLQPRVERAESGEITTSLNDAEWNELMSAKREAIRLINKWFAERENHVEIGSRPENQEVVTSEAIELSPEEKLKKSLEVLSSPDVMKKSPKEVAEAYKLLTEAERGEHGHLAGERNDMVDVRVGEMGGIVVRGKKAIEAYRQEVVKKEQAGIEADRISRAMQICWDRLSLEQQHKFGPHGVNSGEFQDYLDKHRKRLDISLPEFYALVHSGYIPEKTRRTFWGGLKAVHKDGSSAKFSKKDTTEFLNGNCDMEAKDIKSEAERVVENKITAARRRMSGLKASCAKILIEKAVAGYRAAKKREEAVPDEFTTAKAEHEENLLQQERVVVKKRRKAGETGEPVGKKEPTEKKEPKPSKKTLEKELAEIERRVKLIAEAKKQEIPGRESPESIQEARERDLKDLRTRKRRVNAELSRRTTEKKRRPKISFVKRQIRREAAG